jgi:SAM-dependent methyltransferase
MKKYEKEYHEEKHRYLKDDKRYYLARAMVAREQYFRGIVKRNEEVLEYGCGLGQNIYLINHAVGYDVSSFSMEFCRKKGVLITKHLETLPSREFDVVLCCEVLEHVEEPLKILRVIYSKLRKGGKLILVLPVDKWNRPRIEDNNQHLYNWNFNTITNLLVRVGFYPIDYKIMRRTGFKKFLFLFNLKFFWLYLFFTWLAAIIFGSKHMRIISVKK